MAKVTTEQKIQTVFLQMLKSTRYDQIKVSQLAKAAGISRGTFYTYYDSIYDLISDVENSLFNELPQMTAPIGNLADSQKIHDLLVVKLTYIQQHFPTLKLLMGPNGDPYFQYQLGRFFLPMAQEYEHALTHPNNSIELALLNEATNGARMSIIHWWIYHPDAISIDELADFLRRFIQQIMVLSQKEDAKKKLKSASPD